MAENSEQATPAEGATCATCEFFMDTRIQAMSQPWCSRCGLYTAAESPACVRYRAKPVHTRPEGELKERGGL